MRSGRAGLLVLSVLVCLGLLAGAAYFFVYHPREAVVISAVPGSPPAASQPAPEKRPDWPARHRGGGRIHL